MYYAMSPDSYGGWSLDTAEFVENLKLQWPDVEIDYPQLVADIISVEWTLKRNKKIYLTGSFLYKRSILKVTSEIKDAVEFFFWIRERFPQTKDSIFWIDSCAFIIYFKERSAEELINLALARTIELRGD